MTLYILRSTFTEDYSYFYGLSIKLEHRFSLYRTAGFDFQKLCVPSANCIYPFTTILITNTKQFPIHD